jgi:predicted ATPase
MSHLIPGQPLIGRRAELDRLEQLLARARLVTVLGPPGMGKTRLALEYVRRRELDAPHAASEATAYCALGNIESLGALCAELASRLEITASQVTSKRGRAQTPTDALARALAARGPMLLVLDNFEQLVACASETLDAWLRQAPELQCIVTSRERLRIDGEVVFELPSLSLPVSDDDPGRAEAVQLFVERVRAIETDFRLDRSNARTVARLVRKLDGIPLAIELAAARIGVLGLDELEARLPANLDVLARGKRQAPARQATMRGAVQWSWDLLEPYEQAAFMSCGVFHGGFSLAAAEAVLGGSKSDPPVLESIQSLRDKSLLHNTAPAAHSPRFDLYAGIREFAREKLQDSALLPELCRKHAGYFIAEAERAATDVERTGNPQALSWLGVERSNLLAAHEYQWRLCQQGPPASYGSALEGAIHALLALEPVLLAHGPVELLAESIDRGLSHSAAQTLPPILQARALRARAKAAQLQGSIESAERDLDRALPLARTAGDRSLSASLLAELGVLNHRLRREDPARRCYELALEAYRELGDLRQQARTLGNLGALCHDLGDFAAADTHYRAALLEFERLDEPRWEGMFTTNRAILEQERGNFTSARAHYERAIERLERAGEKRLLGITRGNLGVLEHESGNFEAAHALHQKALVELESVGDKHSEALCLARLGATHARLGQPEQARARLVMAEQLLDGHGDPIVSAAVRLNYAFVDLAAGGASEEEILAKVRERMRAARSSLGDDGPSAADVSDDVRSTLRILERAIAHSEPLFDSLKAMPHDALLVGPEASWFRLPGGRFEDLRKHAATRRILFALLAQRLKRGSPKLSMDDLLEAGWPQERIDRHSGMNRVHVALADLRKRGLKPWLKRDGPGYLLDEELRVELVAIDLPENGVLS